MVLRSRAAASPVIASTEVTGRRFHLRRVFWSLRRRGQLKQPLGRRAEGPETITNGARPRPDDTPS